MLGTCRLCEQQRPLQVSHILPAFAFRWKRETSGGAAMRLTSDPNRRVQDDLKLPWLCTDCDQLFSASERDFASQIFHPYLQMPTKRLAYGPWMLHFCTSVSWRVLRYYMEKDHFGELDVPSEDRCKEAEKVWREYLQGRRKNPGDFRQHIIPFDVIESTPGRQVASNINRYLTRAIQMDLLRGTTSIYTFAKLGRFAIFGVVRGDAMPWRGTAVAGAHGVIEPSTKTVPGPLWDYLNAKAKASAAALASLSPAQHLKTQESFVRNVERYAGSDAFRAMQADIAISGRDAFLRPGDQPANASSEGNSTQQIE